MENLPGLDKLKKLQQEGVDTYPHSFDRTHSAAQIKSQYADVSHEGTTEQIRFAGRIMTMRTHGKTTFATLQDMTGQIQIYAGRNDLGEDKHKLINEFDMGDIIGVVGPVFKTKTDEITIRVLEFKLLSKSLRNLPEKWHGLKDVELRYRQRYLDLITNPEVRDIFIKRSKIISAMREFLDTRGYLEIETPMMQPLAGGATARPFKTHHNALGIPLYLRVAPELYHKRVVVGGIEKIYEINRNFRNEGVSTKHNPEFTMMELYTAFWDYNPTMDLCEEMIRFIAQKVLGTTLVEYQGNTYDFGKPWQRFTVLDAIEHFTKVKFQWGEDIDSVIKKSVDFINEKHKDNDPASPIAIRRNMNLHEILHKGNSGDEKIMSMFDLYVENELIQPTIIKDYPSSLSPLSKASDAHPEIAERFEAYIACMEIGNAYSEQNDPILQRNAFEDQVKQSDKNEEMPKQVDEDYLRALEHGMVPASGLGIGIDRLVMLLTNQSSIREVILFPLLRPEA